MDTLSVRTQGSSRRASLDLDTLDLRAILEAAYRLLERAGTNRRNLLADRDAVLAAKVFNLLQDLIVKDEAEAVRQTSR